YAFRLELPKGSQIHDVFSLDVLIKAPNDPLVGQEPLEPTREIIYGVEEWEVEWEVEKIIAAEDPSDTGSDQALKSSPPTSSLELSSLPSPSFLFLFFPQGSPPATAAATDPTPLSTTAAATDPTPLSTASPSLLAAANSASSLA
ncbi:hypothetical protein V496_01386, partial [Pseudogymnoascus sp. VKM F-4515 (FW-2607)]